MKSSYFNNDINYGDIIKANIFGRNPHKIVEFGILDGFSLKVFADTFPNAKIDAYDIFDEFNGNAAKKEVIEEMFKNYKNVSVKYGDFYKKYEDLSFIDILHIDIANNGDVYKFVIENYLPKMSKDGIIILEGGSNERDNIEWMIKYNKPKINTYLEELNKRFDLNVMVIGKVPSITFITRNKSFSIHELSKRDFNLGFFELVNYFTKDLNDDSYKLALNNIDLFNNENCKTIVVELDRKIIATGKILMETKVHNNLRKVGHIEDIIVNEKYRNSGVGTMLISKLVEIGKENNCYKTILECGSDVIQFYKKFGFKEKGTEMCLYY